MLAGSPNTCANLLMSGNICLAWLARSWFTRRRTVYQSLQNVDWPSQSGKMFVYELGSYNWCFRLIIQDVTFFTCLHFQTRPWLFRFLTSGESFVSLAFHFRMARSTVRTIVSEVIDVISQKLQPEFAPYPTQDILAEAAKGYEKRWNFPNCCGSCDGKHVFLTVGIHIYLHINHWSFIDVL